jgi:hypothetical protein
MSRSCPNSAPQTFLGVVLVSEQECGMAASAPRFVGLEVHKQSIVVSVVDELQQVLLPARRVSLAAFEQWATAHLLATDAVVLEASTNAWRKRWSTKGTATRCQAPEPAQDKLAKQDKNKDRRGTRSWSP